MYGSWTEIAVLLRNYLGFLCRPIRHLNGAYLFSKSANSMFKILIGLEGWFWDGSKFSSNHHQIFSDVSLYPLSFFANTSFNVNPMSERHLNCKTCWRYLTTSQFPRSLAISFQQHSLRIFTINPRPLERSNKFIKCHLLNL